MRLTSSLLAATALHGLVFGVAAVVLSGAPAKEVALVPEQLEVEVVTARPDPIAEAPRAAVAAAPSRSPAPAPGRPRIVRRPREVAMLGDRDSTPAPADPPALAGAIAVAVTPPAVSSSPAPAAPGRTSTLAAQGGGGAVSAKPRYRTNPRPDYPIPSQRRREEGIVLLNVQVQPDGTPAAISLNRSCGHPLLDRAALDAVRRWTFEPARAAGVPVSSLVVIPVRFSLDER